MTRINDTQLALSPVAATANVSAPDGPRHSLRSRLLVAAAAVAGVVGLAAAPASAASSNGGIYVVTPAWWGHCVNFGGVAGLATVNSYVGHSQPGNYGDDIAWVPVRLRTSQSIQVKVACKRYGFATGASMSVTINPARNGQSFFIGPDSSYWSN